MKLLKIRWCGDCRHRAYHRYQENYCHHPIIMDGTDFGWKKLPPDMHFPDWCPLENVGEK